MSLIDTAVNNVSAYAFSSGGVVDVVTVVVIAVRDTCKAPSRAALRNVCITRADHILLDVVNLDGM